MSDLAADHADRCRELMRFALRNRTKASKQRDAVDNALAEVERLTLGDASWFVRINAERAHHLSRRRGADDPEAVVAADAALEASRPLDDVVLRALAVRERARLNPRLADRLDLLLAVVSPLADALELDSPVRDVWGIQPGQVYGMAVRELASALSGEGRFEERLAWLARCRSNRQTSKYETAECFRLAQGTLSKLLRFGDVDVLVEELNSRVADLGDDGLAMSARLMGAKAERHGRWIDAGRLYAQAFELTKSNVSRAGLANKAAYCFCFSGESTSGREWALRAMGCWEEISEGKASVTGRTMSKRYLAWADVIDGRWSDALNRYAEAITFVYPRPAPATWVSLAERLVQAVANGVDFGSILGPTAPVADGEIALASVADVARHALTVASIDGEVTLIRARIALAELALLGGAELAEISPEVLIQDSVWLADRRRWWRAGKARMLAARQMTVSGRSEEAAQHATSALELWQYYRSGSDLLDQQWLLGTEQSQYFFAWDLANQVSRPELAARVAEALRGSAISTLLENNNATSAKLRDRAELDNALEAAREDEAGPAVVAVGGPGASEPGTDEPSGEGDDDSKSETPRARSARTAALAASAQQLDRDLEFLQSILPEPGQPAPQTTSSSTCLWIDVHDGDLYAASVSPEGEHRSVKRKLSDTTREILGQLAQPANAQALALHPNRAFWQAMGELGDCLDGLLPDARPDGVPFDLEISPGGVLWAVPWLAVTVRQRLLVTLAIVTVVPSRRCASYLALREIEPIETPVAYFDPGLPGAVVEEKSMMRCWGYEAMPAFGAGGIDLSGRGLFVAAVHGDYRAGGLSAALRFAERSVPASELFDWKFPSLTILGACWLGRIDPSTGGEPLGVALPVIARGARTFIAGLFGIHDQSTGDILGRCYELLAAGSLGAAAALRQAQLQWLDVRGQDELHAWAGLVAIGAH